MVQRAVLGTRSAVRRALSEQWGGSARAAGDRDPGDGRPLVLVALSGGADSLALTAAVAYEAPRLGLRAGAIVVDHGLQPGSGDVAERAAGQARRLGLDPVLVRAVRVAADRGDGPEAAAREARYGAFESAVEETGAAAVLTAHTRDDQAEQVLLALARGAGLRSLAGIPRRRPLGSDAVLLRPFLGGAPEITRAVTEAACSEAGLEAWADPHNDDPAYTRVRVRRRVLPLLEDELGGGVSAALARTADLAAEDAEALEALAADLLRDCLVDAPGGAPDAGGAPDSGDEPDAHGGAAAPGPTVRPLAAAPVALAVAPLAAAPAALRQRAIRRLVRERFGTELIREHTLAIASLATRWRGQGPIHVPGGRVSRSADRIEFRAGR